MGLRYVHFNLMFDLGLGIFSVGNRASESSDSQALLFWVSRDHGNTLLVCSLVWIMS